MIIPEKFADILKCDDGFYGAVASTLHHFEKWLNDNNMMFFPGFTDHGTNHVEAVMRSAESLIRDEAWELLTPADIAICLLSIVLHDSAMHLSEDGFLLLISNSRLWRPRSRFYEPTDWCQLWEAFLTEASHFNEKKLVSLFGKPEPINRPPNDPLQWTEQHKILIGEFIRRHHASLAHEIALEGVPGPAKSRLALVEIQDWMRDLAGLVARSHSLDIRACTDRLPKGGRKVWRQVHTPFLIGLLRIADYLEIQAPRAPNEILQVRGLRSPVSQQEWRNHEAVIDVLSDENDPECLWVDTEPKNVKTFLALQRLFSSIQSELDSTWAVFGEVYGSDSKLRNLGIRIRRIRSTLDDLATFEESVEYVPIQTRFSISDAEVLKLLIEPLYGGNPSYGVRELIQNSVDACLECADYLNHFRIDSPDLAELPADVVVTLEEDDACQFWLTVDDKGIGMTREVIQKYFLKAGSTFRSSEQWHDFHVHNEEPRVLRTGRFGVGLLAAFLLGPEIEVTTRHVNEDRHRGIRFTCQLDDPEIELRWVERSIGTTIRVKVSEKAFKELIYHSDSEALGNSWDWYTADYPKVIRRIRLQTPQKFTEKTSILLGSQFDLPQRFHLPSANSTLPKEWRRIRHPDLDDVQWTWHGPDLVCNNIKICEIHPTKFVHDSLWYPTSSKPSVGIEIDLPSLSVFDKYGKLPINLSRTSLSVFSSTIFNPQLLEAVCRDILAFLLVRIPTLFETCLDYLIHSLSGVPSPKYLGKNKGLLHPALGSRNMACWHWLTWTREGLMLTEPEILRMAGHCEVWFFPEVYPVRPFPSKELIKTMRSGQHGVLQGNIDSWVYQTIPNYYDGYERWVDVAINGPLIPDNSDVRKSDNIGLTHFEPWINFDIEGRAVLVTIEFWKKCLSKKYDDVKLLEISSNTVLLYKGANPQDWLDIKSLGNVKPGDEKDLVAFWKIGESKSFQVLNSPLGQMWKDVFGQGLIPFDLQKRKAQLAHAYNELSEEISRWEKGAGTYLLAQSKAKK